ncbi:hypothetical protein JCM10207_003431 [Rhodosporidiobolus poonsookiae]
MSYSSADVNCAHCGKLPSNRADSSVPTIPCKLCQDADLAISFCDRKCYDAGIQRHTDKNCAGQVRNIDWLAKENWAHFCSPACRVQLVADRVRLRPVEHTDNQRIFMIKNDPIVQQFQLYGRPNSASEVQQNFTQGYVLTNTPLKSTIGSKSKGRLRYVFAIEPRQDKAGVRAVQPQSSQALHDLDADGYIGNLAIEVTLTPRGKQNTLLELMSGVNIPKLEPQPKKVFEYPSAEDLQTIAHAVLFYEIHPNFWRQGLMGEAIRAVLPFIFNILRLPSVIIDPIVGNAASIRLASKLGFVQREDKTSLTGEKQHVFELTRAEWEKGRKGKKKSNKKKKGKKAADGPGEDKAAGGEDDGEGDAEPATINAADPAEVGAGQSDMDRACCRWCQIPSHRCTLGCSGCDWAFWCSQACKTADLTFVSGHKRECDR